MPDQIIQMKMRASVKVGTLLLLGVTLFATWFILRWYAGNTIAEYFSPETRRLEMAQMAASWAPRDPITHWRAGSVIQTDLPPDQISAGVAEFEKAVSLSPNDYRLWMSLGEAQEQAGMSDKAEQSLRQAIKLAPSYAYPRWYLGNLLLRTERYAEGFEELRRASEADSQFQSQLFNLAWQLNKDDFEAMKASVGQTPAVSAAFSAYLIERGRFDEGMRLWQSLGESEKRANRSAADSIIAELLKAKRFHQAMDVWNEIAPGFAYRVQVGKILDGGLEDNLAHGPAAVFGWQVHSSPQVQIGIDSRVGHTGNHSLRFFFQVRQHLDDLDVSQLVPVSGDTQYELECYVQTERLESAFTPAVAVINAMDDNTLATSLSAAAGNNNWQPVSLSFKTPPNTEAIRIKVFRPTCVDTPVCPIFGTVWYDDFNLKSGK